MLALDNEFSYYFLNVHLYVFDFKIMLFNNLNNEIEKINKFQVECLLLNCNSLDRTASALELISSCWSGRWGIYPNLGIGEPSPTGEINELSSDQEFLKTAKKAVELGADILGGCCGSSPRHIRLLQKEFL